MLARLATGAWLLLGTFMLVHGVHGLLNGSIEISTRASAPTVLTASGDDAGLFMMYTWSCVVLGLLSIARGAFDAFQLLFGKPSKRLDVIRAAKKSLE